MLGSLLGKRGRKDLPRELSRLSEKGYDDKSLCTSRFLIAFDALGSDARKEVGEALQKLIFKYWDHPPRHPNMKYVEEEEAWQLKVKKGNTDHRIYVDWNKETQPIPIILSLFHADQTH